MQAGEDCVGQILASAAGIFHCYGVLDSEKPALRIIGEAHQLDEQKVVCKRSRGEALKKLE